VRFAARVGKRKLAAGRYRLALVATDAAGNRSKPVYVQLAITRPRRDARHTRVHTAFREDPSTVIPKGGR
jgi:hypothetical protein